MIIILEVLEPLERNMTKDCFSPLGKVFVNIKKPFSKTILTTAVRTKYSVIYEKTCHKRLKKEKKVHIFYPTAVILHLLIKHVGLKMYYV